MVYGLRYYFRLIGQNKRAIELPSLKNEIKLPVILNRSELRELFVAPALLKHRIVLTLIYSAGLRGQEVINLKIADIDFERQSIHTKKVLRALTLCRTAALGWHKEQCDCCGRERISYNSCGNRHSPRCQSVYQAFRIEDLLRMTLPVKHYHIVFTVPHELNAISMLDSRWFYNLLLSDAWDILRTFGYTHYGVESGAVMVLQTWGENLSLHPHVHCIVPAAGQSLAGNMKHIGKEGKYLYPVTQLSVAFR